MSTSQPEPAGSTAQHAELAALVDRIQASRQDEFRDDVVRDLLEALDRHDAAHAGGGPEGGEGAGGAVGGGPEGAAERAALRELPREDARYETSLNRLVDQVRNHLGSSQR